MAKKANVNLNVAESIRAFGALDRFAQILVTSMVLVVVLAPFYAGYRIVEKVFGGSDRFLQILVFIIILAIILAVFSIIIFSVYIGFSSWKDIENNKIKAQDAFLKIEKK